MSIDDSCKLFVAGLPESITESVLRQLFEAAGGRVVDVSLPRDRATGRPRGFGFVTLSSEDEARAARESLDGSMQAGRSISVRAFQAGPRRGGPEGRPEGGGHGPAGGGDRGAPSGERSRADDRTVYLGNLPYDSTPSDVESFLKGSGAASVARVNLPQDAQGRPRGFGFVTFTTPEAAEAAVVSLRDAELKGRRVSASMAYGRGDRPVSRAARSSPYAADAPGRASEPRRFRDSFAEPAREPAPLGETENEGRGEGRRRKEPKKKKNRAKTPVERQRTRRESEGLRAPRARDWLEDDED